MNAMNRIIRAATVLGLAGMFSLSMAVQDSQAGFGIRVDFDNNGSFESTVQDDGVGDAAGGFPGFISMTASNGGSIFEGNFGSSKPLLGSAAIPNMDLTNSTTTTVGGGVVKVQLSDTDFNGGLLSAMKFLENIGGTFGLNAGASVVINLYRDLANAQFGTGAGTFICTTGTISQSGTAAQSFSGACAAGATVDSQYSITMEAIITHTGKGAVQTSFDSNLQATPEPASMLLLGMGLVGLGSWKRRRSA